MGSGFLFPECFVLWVFLLPGRLFSVPGRFFFSPPARCFSFPQLGLNVPGKVFYIAEGKFQVAENFEQWHRKLSTEQGNQHYPDKQCHRSLYGACEIWFPFCFLSTQGDHVFRLRTALWSRCTSNRSTATVADAWSQRLVLSSLASTEHISEAGASLTTLVNSSQCAAGRGDFAVGSAAAKTLGWNKTSLLAGPSKMKHFSDGSSPQVSKRSEQTLFSRSQGKDFHWADEVELSQKHGHHWM